MNGRIVRVKVSELKGNKYQFREGLDRRTIETLVDLLEDPDMELDPILITQDKEVVSGHHRLYAYAVAGREEIPAVVVDAAEALRLAAQENHRGVTHLSRMERVRLAEKLVESGFTFREISDILGVSVGWLSLRLRKAGPDVLTLDEGEESREMVEGKAKVKTKKGARAQGASTSVWTKDEAASARSVSMDVRSWLSSLQVAIGSVEQAARDLSALEVVTRSLLLGRCLDQSRARIDEGIARLRHAINDDLGGAIRRLTAAISEVIHAKSQGD